MCLPVRSGKRSERIKQDEMTQELEIRADLLPVDVHHMHGLGFVWLSTPEALISKYKFSRLISNTFP